MAIRNHVRANRFLPSDVGRVAGLGVIVTIETVEDIEIPALLKAEAL